VVCNVEGCWGGRCVFVVDESHWYKRRV
jgi:hypothetical protein